MKIRGFVLLAMLVYMHVMTLISMQSLYVTRSINKNMREYLIMSAMHRSAVSEISRVDGLSSPVCRIVRQSAWQFKQYDLGWWRVHGCQRRLGNYDIFYVRETLGVDVCAAILSQNKQMVAPVIYRNTLLQVSTLNQNFRLILQDTIAVPSHAPPACSYPVRIILPGRQMLRRLGD